MKHVACFSGVELLMDYLEGVLPADVRSELEAHVARCERCVAFIDSYRKAPGMVREATDVSLPPDIQRSLTDFLRERRRGR